MPAYLLTWNPKRWEWSTLHEEIADLKRGQPTARRWSAGNTKTIQPGDTLYLMRLGAEPRGIIAKGTATTGVKEELHWNQDRASHGETANVVYVTWEVLDDSTTRTPLPVADLEAIAPAQQWRPFGSGAVIRPDALKALESAWANHIAPQSSSHFSNQLTAGELYTRNTLAKMLGYASSNAIGSGVVTPKAFDSVLLFVTEKKSKDRTQYIDRLEGDILHWEGQTSKRTDHRIIDSDGMGQELLVFYRPKKDHYPNYAFRFEGVFQYRHHKKTPDGTPTAFVLERTPPTHQSSPLTETPLAFEATQDEPTVAGSPDRAVPEVRVSHEQGFSSDAQRNNAIEQRAMVLATRHYEQFGFTVTDTSADHPYDLYCQMPGLELFIEVKGTTGDGDVCTVTNGEVRHAREFPTDLFMVSLIEVTGDHPDYVATGGITRIISPWNPVDRDLVPIKYRYTLP